ncbi:RNA polymerase subunit sigma-24 [Taibaiella sp. KBW10]|uniref:RNA polymerase sigma factor n=1 Tax=Taibaiella sp. KBW10 TaxID=2153357 RepID=UPI000F5B17D6|nr:sigma-70 family RNA polymerase sigma factor [Taibaiella sp. KBW10]RQO30602.1 RNA polymerase subunit sigma-24 [Taibaiella sp. KBW10]
MPENNALSITDTVKKYGSQLLGFIKGKVKKLEDAEDVLQDVWYQFSRLTNINELESVSGWLYFVAKNKITDLYRKRTTDSLEDYTYETEDGEFNIKDVLLLDDSNHPELTMFKEVFWKAFMEALAELPEHQRDTFVLNEIEDKTLQEIADMQQENIKTVISRKGYAVKHLRKRLEPLYRELYS